MIQCPKCGSTNIQGPTYVPRDGFLPEALVYRCRDCGYSQRTRTLDQQKAAVPASLEDQPR